VSSRPPELLDELLRDTLLVELEEWLVDVDELLVELSDSLVEL